MNLAMDDALYNKIGVGYAKLRQPDVRIADQIHAALGSAQSVVNIGAGTGSYEPKDRHVIALEPSAEMIRQRPPGAAPAVQGSAENLPFADDQFDAAMAVLTVHHWLDLKAGLCEMRRVAKQHIVILTFDPASHYFWLVDYMPEIISMDQPTMPKIEAYEEILGPVSIETVAVPHDCTDGFLGAYWRRPHAYLNPAVRASISTFAKLDSIPDGFTRLEKDLASGLWQERYGHLLTQDSFDAGYRLVVADLLS